MNNDLLNILIALGFINIVVLGLLGNLLEKILNELKKQNE